jgi:phosphatidylserine/phosphatidylglycerophosphate/cardiolipin synthase-like enzyme
MRSHVSSLLPALLLAGCTSTPVGPRLVVQPDDGRAPLLSAIAGATSNVRLTIYEITDLASVSQQPPAPADSVVQALMDKARSGVRVQVIVDQGQATTGSSAGKIEQTVAAMRDAGVQVHPSSSAFCYTHQKTLVVDGPTGPGAGTSGTAIIMSLNLIPSYFGTTRDYAVITSEPDVVQEISAVFDADFGLASPADGGCRAVHAPAQLSPPPSAGDTPSLSAPALLWSPVSSKPKLTELIAGATTSLDLTTEELTDKDMTCAIEAVARAPGAPLVRLLVADDTGSSAASVRHLLLLGLANLSIRVMPGLPDALDAGLPQTPLYMHGKQVIADRARAFVGSENLTNTSLLQNRELGILFTEPAMVARLAATFDHDFTTPGASLAATACTPGAGCGNITCP